MKLLFPIIAFAYFFCISFGEGSYVQGNRGEDACPEGSEPITDLAECEEAAHYFQYKFDSEGGDKTGDLVCAYRKMGGKRKVQLSSAHSRIADWLCKETSADEDRVAALESKFQNIGESLPSLCSAIESSSNGEWSCCANADTGRMFCIISRLASATSISGNCSPDDSICSDTTGLSIGNDLESRIASLTTKSTNVATALGSLCQVIDWVANAADTPYDCCSNPESIPINCVPRIFAPSVGITSPGLVPGVCSSTDSACNIDTDTDSTELGNLEAMATNAAASLASLQGPIQAVTNGNLSCCSNSENGKTFCYPSAFGPMDGLCHDENDI